MGSAENPELETRGKEEMHELVRSTFAALEDAELPGMVKELRERVFARNPDDLLETTIDKDVCHWNFKPMVELMLRHVLGLARDEQISADERKLEINAVIELAGF
jgi:hypothetical protein